MAFIFSKAEVVDLFMGFCAAKYPDRQVDRRKVLDSIEEIKDNGEIVWAAAGKKNLTGVEVLVSVGLGLSTSLIYDAAKSSVNYLRNKSKDEIAKDVQVSRDKDTREVQMRAIEFVKEQKVAAIEKQLKGSGAADEKPRAQTGLRTHRRGKKHRRSGK